MNKQQAYNLFQSGKLQDARQLCRKLVKESPNDATIWHLLGLINARSQHYKRAEEHLLKALALDENSQIYLALGQLYLVMSQLDNAQRNFEKVVEFNENLDEAYSGLATIYGSVGKEEKSIEYYQKIISMGKSNETVYGNVASLYERLRKNDLAKLAAGEALLLNVNNVSANLILSRQERSEEKYDDSIERLSRLLKENMHPSIFANVSTELGYTLDKKGEYKKAYSAFLNASKATLKMLDTMPVKKEEYLTRLDKNKEWFTAEKINSLEPCNLLEPSPVFFVGFPRSGTTLMEQILTSNPAIEATGEELLITNLIEFSKSNSKTQDEYPYVMKHYIGKDERLILREEYLNKLEAVCGHNKKILIDKLPLNLIEIGFINQVFPESKIIMAYRDPRDVCLSCFMQNFNLNAAMAQFLTLKDTAKFYAKTMDLWLHYKSTLNLNLIEYKYEDLVENVEAVSKSVATFIGAEWSSEMKEFYKHAATKKVTTPSFVDVTKPIYSRSISRWKNYTDEMVEVEGILKPYIEAFGY